MRFVILVAFVVTLVFSLSEARIDKNHVDTAELETMLDSGRTLDPGPHYNKVKRTTAAQAAKAKTEKKEKELTKRQKMAKVLDAEDVKAEQEAEKVALAPPPNEEPIITLDTRYLPAFIIKETSSAEDYMSYFETADKAPGYCDGKLLDDLSRFNASSACAYESDPDEGNTAVMITDLAPTVTEKSLAEYFDEYGHIEHIEAKKHPKTGRIDRAQIVFSTPSEAARAIEEGDGRMIENSMVTVQYARLKHLSRVVRKGKENDAIYLITIHTFPQTGKNVQFRMGTGFTDGGAVLLDGRAVTVRAAQNLQWGGENWSTGQILSTPTLHLKGGMWHSIQIVGIVKDSDGKDFSIEADFGLGFQTVSTNELREEQMRGWRTRNVFMTYNRGRGDPLHSVIETGFVSYGVLQEDWNLASKDPKSEASFKRRVEFGSWFNFVPDVQVFISRLDAAEGANVRVFAKVLRASSSAFELEISSINSTAIASVGVSWIAYTATPLHGSQATRACYLGMENKDGWTLGSGSESRSFAAGALFEDQFARAPRALLIGSDMFDVTSGDFVYDARVTAVDKKGLDFAFATNFGSRVVAAHTCAVAIAPVDRAIQTGEELLNWQTAPGFNLDVGSGLREYRMWVKFSERFDDRPDVVLTVSGIEAEGATRFDAHVTRVHNTGFEIHVSTWGKTKVHAIRLRWLATFAGQRYVLHGGDGSAPSRKCTCTDASEEEKQNQLIKEGKQTVKDCTCKEDQNGARAPVYVNYAEGFGGALEFVAGQPKQKPLFYAFKRKVAKDQVALFYYTNSKHEDRLYTTKFFDPTDEWHGGSVAMYVLADRASGSVPLYRFFDPITQRHRYTVTTEMFVRRDGMYELKDEEGKYRKEGAYRYEGVQCYVYPYLGE